MFSGKEITVARPDNHDDNYAEFCDDNDSKYDDDNDAEYDDNVRFKRDCQSVQSSMALKSRGLVCQDTAACVNCEKKRLKLTDLKQPDTGQKVG